MCLIRVLFGLVFLGAASADSNFVEQARSGNVDYVQQKIAEGTIDLDYILGNHWDTWTALMAASNYTEVVMLLLEAGARVDQATEDGRTALMVASYRNSHEVVRVLLAAGATVDQAEEYGSTALMEASMAGSIESVKLLLDAGATVDQTDKYGNTALMIASSNNHIAITKVLLQAGANVNAVDEDGKTALHRLAKWRDFFGEGIYMIQVLLQNGADTSKLDNTGRSPSELARFYGYNKTAELIDNYSGPYTAVSTSQQDTSNPPSTEHLILLIQAITREIFLTGSLLAVTIH